MSVWAIIPVKSLRNSKSRLADLLSAEKRAELTRDMLTHVLTVLNQVSSIDRVLVVSRDPEVLKIARQHKATTFIETDRQGLNLALTGAAHVAWSQQAMSVLILPSDLPFITVADVEAMISAAVPEALNHNRSGYHFTHKMMAICSDHKDEGTNAMLLTQQNGFTFQYGPGSFWLHLAEAEKNGLESQIVDAAGIRFDLDTEEDWQKYVALLNEPVAAS